jgi:hypothetical protein
MSSPERPVVSPAFPSGAQDFQPAAAWWLARWSELAYRSKRDVAQELEAQGFEKVVFFDVAGTQGYLGLHPGMQGNPRFGVVAFRGTENDYSDVLTDITFFKGKAADSNLRAHAGFLMALKQVWGTSFRPRWEGTIEVDWKGPEGLGEALEEAEAGFPDLLVFFTGHSLGGALATLAAWWWEEPEAQYKTSVLYTFGSPRVAARALAGYLNEKLPAYRVVNSTDIVPRVPTPVFGFRHVGELAYFTRAGRLYRPGSWWIMAAEFTREIFSVATLFFPAQWVRNIQPRLFTNHRIKQYVGKLLAVLGRGV